MLPYEDQVHIFANMINTIIDMMKNSKQHLPLSEISVEANDFFATVVGKMKQGGNDVYELEQKLATHTILTDVINHMEVRGNPNVVVLKKELETLKG